MSKQLEIFEVHNGEATKVEKSDLLTVQGRVPPQGAEIVVIPGLLGSKRRIALYPANGPKPFPLSSTVDIQPGNFGRNDLLNLIGPYLPYLLRRALNLDEGGLKAKDWVVIIGLVLLLAVGGLNLYVVAKLAKHFGAF